MTATFTTPQHVKSKRRSHNRLGWSVQWGTIRMLGTFLSTPAEVPDVVTRFMAEQLDIDDPSCLKLYPDRLPTQYEHAREIRELLRYRDFDEGELELRSYVASRVWNSVESRRALFDRAVVWLLRNRVGLPGISVLSRLVTEVRAGEYERIHGLIATAPPSALAEKLIGLLEVPTDGHVSELERMRRTVHSISGAGLKLALDRVTDVCELKAGEVDLARIPLVKQAELARYGMASKAPTIRGLTPERRTATMLVTVRYLEGAAVDDALLLFDALMTTKLLARAERLSTSEKLRTLPRFRKAAGVVAGVLAALRPPGSFQRKNNGLPGHSLGRPASGQEADMAADLHFRCFFAGNYREACQASRYRSAGWQIKPTSDCPWAVARTNAIQSVAASTQSFSDRCTVHSTS